MRMTQVIFIFCWAAAMFRCGSFKAHLPVSYRLQNALLSLFLIFSASYGVDLILTAIFHPGIIQKYFYFQSGIFPPLATLATMILVLCASVVELVIGFDMAQQKRKGRVLALRIIPYLAAVTVLDVARIVSARSITEPNRSNFILGAFLAILLPVCFYVWLYCFCRSRQAEELMTNVA